MRLRPPLRVSVTRHEEKEQKLQEFSSSTLPALQHGGDASHATHLLIIARSLESPLVKAVTGLTTRSPLPACRRALILAQVDREPLPEEWGRGIPSRTRSAGPSTRA